MRTKLLFLFTILLFIGFSFYFFKTTNSNSVIKSSSLQHLSPADAYYIGRNYPNIGDGENAFRNALERAYYLANRYRNANTPWTNEGPTNIGGRITSIAIDPTNSQIIYVGTPSSGVFKTVNEGNTWTHIFKDEKSLSIGSIAIDPTNSQIIYIGTGDNAMSGLNYNGRGVYKSNNGGNTWTNIGLQQVGVINKLLINPKNTQIIYAGTMGNIYNPDINRGLYKSIDGGVSWANILFLGNNVGIGDMVMDFSKPDTIFVTGRHRQRTNNLSIVKGVKTKVYRSYNGGSSWDTLSTGANGENCKITLAMSQTNPSKIYASYCDSSMNYSGIFKTTNSGNTWTLVSNNSLLNMNSFGWYFGEIELDPNDDNTIYWMGVDFFKSTNAGVTWTMDAPVWYTYKVHADKHDMKFINSSTFLLATDGGLYKAKNGGGDIDSNWTYISQIPITQFYRVAYNKFDSVNYYGGSQDNGTEFGSLANGISTWQRYFGGDGFQPAFDENDENILYTETQNENIYATETAGMNWDPISQSISSSDRCNWNMPYILSTHVNNTMYTGSYRVYKNTYSLFDSWTPISGDLTNGTNDNFHTISAIDNSLLSAPLIYVGTSDAKLWVTTNDGSTWTQINSQMPNRYVSCIKASPNKLSSAFVSYWGYKDNDTASYIFYSDNYGSNWTPITSASLPNFAINDIWIKADGTDSSIIIANDGGVYSTIDRGANWMRVGSNMPFIPVFDIDYNIALKKIFVGTFALGIQSISIDSAFKTKPNIINGISSNKIMNFTIFPNPCSDYFICEPNFETDYSVTIYNTLGQILHKEANLQGVRNISIKQLQSGNYFILVDNKKSKVVKAISKI